MRADHFRWWRYDELDDTNSSRGYSFLFLRYVLPFEKLQVTSKWKDCHITQQPQCLFLVDKPQSSGGTCICGASHNYSRFIKCRRGMLDLEQRPLIVWVKNNAAVLSFLKASDKVFCSFVVSRGSGGVENLWTMGHFKDTEMSHRSVSGWRSFCTNLFKYL